VDLSNKEITPDGWRIPIFSGSDFDVSYRYLCARNSSGQVKHETKDRVVRVLAGRLFVMVDGETQELNANQSIALERGVVHEIATSGTEDAELILCQSHDYEKDLQQIVSSSAVTSAKMSPVPTAAPQISRRSESKALEQAAQLGAVREVNRKAARTPFQGRAPLAGQQVSGLNPRPAGPGGFGGPED
jgi:mannose-6-phosphate isomerase-like protein (cupin superfamily)